MQQEVKVPIGRMDKESSPETVGQYDYIDGHNLRTVGKEGSDANYLTNLEGNRLITSQSPIGQNRGIGGAKFDIVSKAYRVVYNSNGYHQIVEFDYNTMQESVVYENRTDSGNVDLLNLSANSYFCDVRLMHERFLILNDDKNNIYCINIQELKDNRGNRVVTKQDLTLAKEPSLIPPTFEYQNDSSRTSNNIKGNLFQFRTQFEYSDFRASAWSTVSKRVVPIDEPADGYGQQVQAFNVLKVKVKIGTDRVDKINIGARTGLNNWILVKSVDRDYITSLPNQDTIVGTTQEAYNPVTNEYIFLFHNDGNFPVLDQIEVENPYDAVPHSAETVELINGNILAIGGLKEGYDRPTIEDFSISVSTYFPNINTGIDGGGNLDIRYQESSMSIPPNAVFTRVDVTLTGTPKAGDRITIETRRLDSSLTLQSYGYTVTAFDVAGGLPRVYQSMASSMGLPRVSYTNNGLRFETDTYNRNDGSRPVVKSMSVQRQDIGVATTKSINTLKTNSSYQLAIAYMDEYGRYFPIVTDDRFIAKTPSYTSDPFNLPQISWNIQQRAPEGAVSYQVLLSENQTHQSSIYLTGVYSPEKSTTGYLAFEMKSLERFFQNENESQVTYDFTKGDKVTLVYASNGQNNTPQKWFRYPFIDLDIVDFKVEQSADDPNDVTYTLKVRNSAVINVSDFSNREVLMELYTPKKRDIPQESVLFYEIGLQYPIVNGNHSVTTGVIREGDWFYKGRLYESNLNQNTAIVYLVEDPNFSDNYESKYWSSGRARTYNDEVGRTEKEASIRYSDEYVYGSKYNGINRFYLERIYGEQGGQTTAKYGSIKRLEMRDNGLVCIQEFKVGIIPVYKSIIYDNTDTSLVADSGKIFGAVQYRVGNYGCGNAKESVAVSRNSLIYFIDDNNCVPIRDAYNGLEVIDVNMSQYFIEHIQRAKSSNSKIFGYVDDLNNEYNITIEDVRGRVFTLSFADSVYTDSDPIDYTQVTGISAQNGTVTLSTGGTVTYTPNNNFVGTDYVTFFYKGEQRQILVNVLQGDSVPDSFSFPSKSNQQLNTVVESDSILVSGINTLSPISVTGGAYQVNGGSWTTAEATVVNGDAVRVRGTSSTQRDTVVTVSLNIGTVIGNFNIRTIPEDVTPNQYLDINGEAYVENGVVSGTLTMSHAITAAYSIQAQVEYSQFGSSGLAQLSFSVPSGQTTATSSSTASVSSNSDLTRGTLNLGTSTLTNGTEVVCQDGLRRIVRIQQNMILRP